MIDLITFAHDLIFGTKKSEPRRVGQRRVHLPNIVGSGDVDSWTGKKLFGKKASHGAADMRAGDIPDIRIDPLPDWRNTNKYLTGGWNGYI